MYRALLCHSGPPPLIKPSVQRPTTPNQYNLLRNEEALPCWSTPCVQGHTTPNQYNIWQIWTYPVQVDPSTGPNLLIEPKCRVPYYTKPVSCSDNYKHTQCRWTPPLIEPKCTEPYYTSPVLCMDLYGHSAIEPYYSTYISHRAECRCTDLVSLSPSITLSLSLSLSLSTPKKPPANWAQVNTALLHLVFYHHHFQLSWLCNWPSAHSSNAHFLSSSFSTVVTLQLTICRSMSSLQYTIFRCQGYICSPLKLSQFLQYLPKYAL